MAGKEIEVKLVYNNLPRLSQRSQQLAADVINKVAHDIEYEVKRSFGPPKHGNVYTRGGRTHQASAPGEAPAIDTSTLHNATHCEQKGPLEWWVVPATEYAYILENFMDRPFLRPAVEKNRVAFETAMGRIVANG
jgi:hypothetical protein